MVILMSRNVTDYYDYSTFMSMRHCQNAKNAKKESIFAHFMHTKLVYVIILVTSYMYRSA